jgi:hypothetical protein
LSSSRRLPKKIIGQVSFDIYQLSFGYRRLHVGGISVLAYRTCHGVSRAEGAQRRVA